MTGRIRVAAAVLVIGGIAVAAAGCSPQSSESADGKTTIEVGDRPSADRPEDRKYFDERVSAFEEANPDIDVKAVETAYDPTTFQALAAGGSLPDVLSVPLTEPQGLIKRGQAADLTDTLKSEGLLDSLNPAILKLASDADGKAYGVPTNAYSFGLVYNRALFTAAGLDPDAPPTTWDEVRTAAQQITAKTGAAGFSVLTTANTGGWQFTGMTYSFGGTVENADGTKATFDDTPSADALALLQTMQFEDGTLPANTLYDADSQGQDFAAGKIGMMIGASDRYYGVVQNLKLPAEDFGIGGMPQDGGSNGTLSGGSVQIVNPNATDAERTAAVKWISFLYLQRYFDQDTAVADAKASNEAGSVTGLPGLAVVNEDAYDTYFDWIADYINVPSANFTPYLDASAEIPVVAEPVNNAQEVYGALDTVIQTVLTDRNADIDSLLSQASTDVQGRLTR
ncbi:extracellular solute-binding protein [Plantibacter sp. lyk4-40-MEA-4]|uniref:extracellular solute-binding protein n=1 Tax=Plantibacter sp. lyk4-40-MEA-4 TaxID=3040298 RepID=UPI00254A6078|nr:extracellular solute-binding protein [Plantibacter sp. lyk4-40-MEA-4]